MSSGRPMAEHRQSRRQFLLGAGGAAGAAALGGGALAAARVLGGSSRRFPPIPVAAAPASPASSFRSRPNLHPAVVSVASSAPMDDGFLFLGPGAVGLTQAGPLIADGNGDPVWFRPLSGPWLANFRSWSYRGAQVLAWWEGRVETPLGYGRGAGLIVDASYREVARILPVGGAVMDMHELRLTPEGTVLFTCYPRLVEADLTSVGGPGRARVLESVFQEVDLRTGRLLLEWHSLEHVPVGDSYKPLADPYDYLHLNSVSVAPDGNLLVSGRHTWTVYKLDRRTGAVIWRLGGKRSQFDLPSNGSFSWQHDAEQPSDGTVTVFDNGYDGHTQTEWQSRGLVLQVDEERHVARLVHALYHPMPVSASAMGSVQMLSDGRILVGWGSEPYLSEFAANGALVADFRLASGQQCYRGFRLPWAGEPHHRPALAAVPDDGSTRSTLYASWNGATNVAFWRVHAGSHHSHLRPIGTIRRRGFETGISVDGDSGFVAVSALDVGGRVLGASRPVRL